MISIHILVLIVILILNLGIGDGDGDSFSFQISPVFTNECLAKSWATKRRLLSKKSYQVPILTLVSCQKSKRSAKETMKNLKTAVTEKILSPLEWKLFAEVKVEAVKETDGGVKKAGTTGRIQETTINDVNAIYNRQFIKHDNLFLCLAIADEKFNSKIQIDDKSVLGFNIAKENNQNQKLFSNKFRLLESMHDTKNCLWNVKFEPRPQSAVAVTTKAGQTKTLPLFKISYHNLASVSNLKRKCRILGTPISEAEYCTYFLKNGIDARDDVCVKAFFEELGTRFSFHNCIQYENRRKTSSQQFNFQSIDIPSHIDTDTGKLIRHIPFTMTKLDAHYIWSWWSVEKLTYLLTFRSQLQPRLVKGKNSIFDRKIVNFNFLDTKTENIITVKQEITPLLIFLFSQFRHQFAYDSICIAAESKSKPKSELKTESKPSDSDSKSKPVAAEESIIATIDSVVDGCRLFINETETKTDNDRVVNDGRNAAVTALDLLYTLQSVLRLRTEAVQQSFGDKLSTFGNNVDRFVNSGVESIGIAKLDNFIEQMEHKGRLLPAEKVATAQQNDKQQKTKFWQN